MARTLYLKQTKAQGTYNCPGCQEVIPKGSAHFRHDPHPYARVFDQEPTTHWCFRCIDAVGVQPDRNGRIRVSIVSVLSARSDASVIRIPRIEVVGIGQEFSERLVADPALVYNLTPTQFESLMCERLDAMGLEPKQVRGTYVKDGGIDIIFWPKRSEFPMLGAMQVKHHRSSGVTEGVGAVRDFAGAIAGHPFNMGILVTSTTFSPDARWFARNHTKLVRLRDFSDIARWLSGSFDADVAWRDLPDRIEVCPGISIPIGTLRTGRRM